VTLKQVAELAPRGGDPVEVADGKRAAETEQDRDQVDEEAVAAA